MTTLIKGSENNLYKALSSDFEYHIPHYQRPYAWTTEEAGILLQDLLDFWQSENSDENYFVGSIVLVKNENAPRAEVVDGQQRLTTLTILLSVLVSMIPNTVENGPYIGSCKKYVIEPGDETAGLAESPRLFLRDADQGFFEKYVQSFRINELLALPLGECDNESKVHIKENAKIFLDVLKEALGSNLEKHKSFIQFLIQRTYLVTVSTPEEASAYRIFTVMNSRGLDLLPMDLIKADVISHITDENRRSVYAEKWEALEADASRKGFDDIFSHTRMIYAKKKAKKTLNEEFKTYVLNTGITPEELIDEILEPYTYAYITIKNCSYDSDDIEVNANVNESLKWLNKFDNSDWMPVAIKFLTLENKDELYVAHFFRLLERLASFFYSGWYDVNDRINRYAAVLTELEAKSRPSFDNPVLSLELTDEEKKNFIEDLNGDLYLKTSKKRNYFILRLDRIIADKSAEYNTGILTIEHVLPQTVGDSSEWASLWPDEAVRSQWLNKIGNLIPLSKKKNSEAQNYDFEEKKKKYFSGKNGVSTFALATQVINEQIWTPEVVETRQRYLIDMFRRYWDL